MIPLSYAKRLRRLVKANRHAWKTSWPHTGNQWEFKVTYGNYKLEFNRYIRGDVYLIQYKGKILFEFVDQSYQYSNILDIHDMKGDISIPKGQFEVAYQMLCRKD